VKISTRKNIKEFVLCLIHLSALCPANTSTLECFAYTTTRYIYCEWIVGCKLLIVVHLQALQNALDISLQLCLQIPFTDIMAFVKLSKAYFSYLEVLFRNHLDVLCGLDASIFLQLVRYTQEGLQSYGKLCMFYCLGSSS
jgi:hypothetical protein